MCSTITDITSKEKQAKLEFLSSSITTNELRENYALQSLFGVLILILVILIAYHYVGHVKTIASAAKVIRRKKH